MRNHYLRMSAMFYLFLAMTAVLTAHLSAQIPKGDTVIELETVATGLTAPISATHAGDGSGRLFIVEQSGQIRILQNGVLSPTPFLDISAKIPVLNAGFDERGLLGLAFHPDYDTNGRFFVRYSAPRTGGPSEPCFGSSRGCHEEVLAEYSVSLGDPDLADPTSEIILFTIDEPQFNHNAGEVAFGPDGFLYFTLGDGGGGRDGLTDVPPSHGPIGNGQNIETALGSILRIDVDSAPQVPLAYAVPADNPFVGITGVDEIYAYGMRNPYRFSFDDGPGGDGRLLLADVGQNLFEEVNIVQKGGNYGWVTREGLHCFDPFNPLVPPASCPSTGPQGEPLIDPIVEYAHPGTGFGPDGGITVVGGFVYRGTRSPSLVGKYIFGDFSGQFSLPSGRLYYLEEPTPGSFEIRELQIGLEDIPYGLFLKGFGEDEDGEIYACGSTALAPFGNTGVVDRIVILPKTVHIVAGKDNTLFESATGSLSSGSGAHFYSGKTGPQDGINNRRGLLWFDVAANLPAGATVTSAKLQLNMSKTPFPIVARTVQLRRVLKDWGEGSSISPQGAGVPAAPGDATWLHTFFNTVFWANPGGDFSGIVTASASVGNIGSYTWGSTPQTTSDVQAWLDDPVNNFGWLLLGDESTSQTAKQFDSRENAIECNRPVLTVKYVSNPMCSSPADLDGNCAVNLLDFSQLSIAWLASNCCIANNWCQGADMTPLGSPDGSVNSADLQEFVSHWLE